jgi:hypothetical protein
MQAAGRRVGQRDDDDGKDDDDHLGGGAAYGRTYIRAWGVQVQLCASVAGEVSGGSS